MLISAWAKAHPKKQSKNTVFDIFWKYKIQALPNGRTETKMQDKKETRQKNTHSDKKSKSPYIHKLLDKLSPSDAQTAKRRARKIVSGGGSFLLSWILSGGVFLFDTQPFALAALCATEQNLFPIFFGILVAVIGKRAPVQVLWGALAILIFRIIISFIPDFHEKRRDGIKATTINLSGFYDGNVPLLAEGITTKKKFRDNIITPTVSFLERILGISSDGIPHTAHSPRDRARRYNENLPAKALFSSIGGFVFGLFVLIDGDYSFFDMFGALSLIFLTPLLVVLFSGMDSSDVPYKGWMHSISWFFLLVIALNASNGTYLLGIYLAPLAAMLFTLFITDTRGTVSGCLCGIIFGLLYSPLYAPLLFICALAYGMFSTLKKSMAFGLVCLATVLWCYYFGGTQGLVQTLTPMLIAVPIFYICEKYYEILFPERITKKAGENEHAFERKHAHADGIYFAEAVREKEKNESMTDKLGALSEAFSSLSKTFNDLVDRFRRPDILGLKKISDGVFEKNCKDCRNCDICWGAEYSETLETVNKITSMLHTKGFVEPSDLSESFYCSCPRADRIICDVNNECKQATAELIQGRKTDGFASNFDDISAILRDALEGEGEEYECDLDAGAKIYDMLTSLGYKIRGVVVCGKRCKRILIKSPSASTQSDTLGGAKLCKQFSELLGVELMGPVFEMSPDETVMMFCSKPKLSAICSHGRLAADNDRESAYSQILEGDGVSFFKNSEDSETACGDCTKVFVNKNSYFYSLISDGMGSGEDAALSSEICSMFVEKMIMAGNRADITVRMLNNFLRSENIGLGKECSATLDLFELDLISGSASFIKSGAAPTFICREKTVYKVNSRTMPVGIMKQADAKLTKFDTLPWDLVVMISDGCCPDSEDCPWLVDYLTKISLPQGFTSPEKLEEFTCEVKDKILSLAVENSPCDRHRDDISVSVVLICA